jgi:hypothetical protein
MKRPPTARDASAPHPARARHARREGSPSRSFHTQRARDIVVVDAQHSLIPSVPDGNSMGLSVALVLAEH